MASENKKAPSEATLRAEHDRRHPCRRKTIPIIAHCICFCILLLALAGLCGLGALIEEGMLSGLVLALACAVMCRTLAALLPEGRIKKMRRFYNLRVRFAQYEMSQKEVAEAAGLATGTMSNRMNGRVPFNAWEMDAIGKALEIPREEFGKYFFD